MKILYLFRDSFEAKYILSELNKKSLVDKIILETGKKAKQAKLKGMLKNTTVVNFLIKIIDIISILIYNQIMTAGLYKKLGKYSYPNKFKFFTDDANDNNCIKFINKYKPDILFIYGSSILKKVFLTKIKTRIINIHSGIVPMYRNVHSDFWAFKNTDYKNLGVSLMCLDKGIDSGGIFMQKTINFKKTDKLVEVKVKILKLIPDLIETLIEQIKTKQVKIKKQQKTKIGFYQTPRFIDIIKFFYNSRV